MTTTREKNYSWFIGTDISRNKLDHAVMRGKDLLFHRETENDVASIKAFVMELKQLKGFTISKSVFCMENTGLYANHLVTALRKFKANIVREPSVFIMRAQGAIRGKTDKLDSIRIAEYAYLRRHSLRLLPSRRAVIDELHEINSMRTRLISYHMALKVPITEGSAFIKKKLSKNNLALCQHSIAALKADCASVDERMMEVVNGDPELKHIYEIVMSVDYIGPITALHMIVATNEFKSINNPKKFACYAGVAPFGKESGARTGRKRVSALANKKMKSLLHLCALQAMRFCPELKSFYQRKTEVEGKPKMAVINAIRYKLILRVFACVSQNRKYEKNYINPRAERRSALALAALAEEEKKANESPFLEEVNALQIEEAESSAPEAPHREEETDPLIETNI